MRNIEKLADKKHLLSIGDAVSLIGAEMFYRKDLAFIVPGLPDIGKPAGGERAFHSIGRYQAQPLWYLERSG